MHPQWHNYSAAWNEGHLASYLAQLGHPTAIIVVGQLATSILAAYAFAFLEFPLKRTLFVVFLATLMIPFEVTFITNLATVTWLGWFNTYQGLAVPFLATGFGIFLLRQAFLQIPRDLQEAAILDGYGHWRFMARVAVPLARPSVAALGVFSFLSAWNQYLWPLVVDRRQRQRRHRPDRPEAAARHPGRPADVALAGAVIAVPAAGGPPDRLPEAAGAEPDGGRRQVPVPATGRVMVSRSPPAMCRLGHEPCPSFGPGRPRRWPPPASDRRSRPA